LCIYMYVYAHIYVYLYNICGGKVYTLLLLLVHVSRARRAGGDVPRNLGVYIVSWYAADIRATWALLLARVGGVHS
jgi:hypothetical protein